MQGSRKHGNGELGFTRVQSRWRDDHATQADTQTAPTDGTTTRVNLKSTALVLGTAARDRPELSDRESQALTRVCDVRVFVRGGMDRDAAAAA